MIYDVIIIGAGAAGCSSAIYATRYALKTLLVGGSLPGGLITEALEVENYPGFLKIGGRELAHNFLEQAKSLGAEFVSDVVTKVCNVESFRFSVGTAGGKTYFSKSVILVTATSSRYPFITA